MAKYTIKGEGFEVLVSVKNQDPQDVKLKFFIPENKAPTLNDLRNKKNVTIINVSMTKLTTYQRYRIKKSQSEPGKKRRFEGKDIAAIRPFYLIPKIEDLFQQIEGIVEYIKTMKFD